jgi:hypothetical protein
MHAGRLSANGVHTRGIDFDVLAIAEEAAEKSHRHRAATDVARADKKNVFHNLEKRPPPRSREPKIKPGQVNVTRPRAAVAA